MRTRRTAKWKTAAALALGWALTLEACGGGLTVSPTSPTETPPPAGGAPITLNIRGTLTDGGSFEGFVTYGARDMDPRADYGRFNGGGWEIVVKGGATTKDVRFSNMLGGRAVIETYRSPFPAVGVVFLWPDTDPPLQSLTPHFSPVAGYVPDAQPTLRDFGSLIPGSLTANGFGLFVDGLGGQVLVDSAQLR